MVITTALDVVPKFLSVTAQERALFSQISTSRYFVTLFFSLNLAQAETVFIHPHAFPEKINHVSVWGNPGGNAPVFIGYQLADKHQNAATLFGTLALDVFQLGHGLFTVPLYQKEWSYFPRVGSQAMRGGYFDDVEALQGKDGIYYAGSSLSFETVEHTARFARSLVHRIRAAARDGSVTPSAVVPSLAGAPASVGPACHNCQDMTPLRIDVWSDIACPWCYIGRHRLETARRASSPEPVTVVWRSFELDPSAAARARSRPCPSVHRLANKYGTSERQAQAMIDRVMAIGRNEGIAFDFDRVRPGNSFDAHRLLQFARRRDPGLASALAERLFRGHFSEGVPIGQPEALVRLATDVGLDADEVAAVLASDAHADDVRADEDEAAELGIDGVPFFVVGGRFGVAGAQPPELLREVFSRVRARGAAESARRERDAPG